VNNLDITHLTDVIGYEELPFNICRVSICVGLKVQNPDFEVHPKYAVTVT